MRKKNATRKYFLYSLPASGWIIFATRPDVIPVSYHNFCISTTKYAFFANIKVNFTHHRIIRLPLRAGRSKHFAPCLPGRRQTERLQNQSVSRIIQADKNFLYFFKDGG